MIRVRVWKNPKPNPRDPVQTEQLTTPQPLTTSPVSKAVLNNRLGRGR
jgi:hypothetical protein